MFLSIIIIIVTVIVIIKIIQLYFPWFCSHFFFFYPHALIFICTVRTKFLSAHVPVTEMLLA